MPARPVIDCVTHIWSGVSLRASPLLSAVTATAGDVVINLQLLKKMAYRPNTDRELSCVMAAWGWILDLEVVAIILMGAAAIGGIAYLLREYRSMRDLDDWS
jgi:hypothetical protein